ncbi:glycosyltransferase family 32 protein [Auriscalpium vulgare]|uniref:Glycosyltransferase family 32 protein n=1 Tax=Auriscalpium vulgare TaxID=40419 RepID=A0ACB8RL43_9AGAM|nr:glycosyltransferase family 32 protein [Auriscalpium vulgare]
MSRAGYTPLPTYGPADARSRHRSTSRSPTEENAFLSHEYPPSSRDNDPPSRHRRRWQLSSAFRRPPRLLLLLLAVLTPVSLFAFYWVRSAFDPRGTLIFYPRQWIQPTLIPPPPLAGCFKPDNVSPLYNISERVYGAKHTDIQAGIIMQLDMDCLDFAGTIPDASHLPPRPPGAPRTKYHTYWRSDREPFRERQEWMLKSFFATQPVERSLLILWSDGNLSGNTILRRYVERYPDAFELRILDTASLAKGTALVGTKHLLDGIAAYSEDRVRLLVLWSEGGVWVDVDSLLTRDLTPLLEHEFVTQWDCYDQSDRTQNGALMHFYQNSPYLCEAFHILAESGPPPPSSPDWGANLYAKIWRRLVADGIPPFRQLPFCFSDSHSCRSHNRIPHPFESGGGSWFGRAATEEGEGLDPRLSQVFSIHLHHLWKKDFPSGGWVRNLLLSRYERTLAAKETHL